MSNEEKNQKTWLGITLVAIGAYFLLRNLDLIPYFIPRYLFGWEMVFVIIGGSMLATRRREGFIFLAIGGFFLLHEIFYWAFHVRDWWPLVLIIIGISIFLRKRDNLGRTQSTDDNDFFEDTSIFGGSEKSFTSQNFKGGKVTSIFGGSNIDFSNAKMEGNEVVLDVFTLFGGNNFAVPNDWTIINDTWVVFGGYSDQRSRSAVEQNDPNKVLRIKGSVVFGGCEVKGV